MYTTANHQGIIALVDSYEYADLDEILEKAFLSSAPPFIVVLDGIEDPQNLGSIIRTSECAGVHGIIIPQHNSVEVTGTVARTSAGAIEHMLIARETNLVNCLRKLKEKGFWIVGADMAAERDYFNCEIPSPTVLVVGGEGTGIRKLVRETCDISVKIPMRGQISSLNASVAAGLIIYEVIRQQSPKDKS
jgi:23S rRNA (guanosine2251-2'-O)-methyltransferase